MEFTRITHCNGLTPRARAEDGEREVEPGQREHQDPDRKHTLPCTLNPLTLTCTSSTPSRYRVQHPHVYVLNSLPLT